MIVVAVFGPGLGEYDTREEHIYYGTMAECEQNMKVKEAELMTDPSFRGASITCKSR
jgi:hypothetical protein